MIVDFSFSYATLGIVILNTIAMTYMIFKEHHRKPESLVSWLLVFAFLPVVGFVIYVFFGSGLSLKNRRMLKRKKFYNSMQRNYYRGFVNHFDDVESKFVKKLLRFNIKNAQAVPTFDNKITYFNSGKDKLKSLLRDIKNAKHSINIEYYIFGDDWVGKEVMNALCERAQAGVKVKLIYDSVGCLRTQRRFFRKLKKAGGEVKEFFPPLFHIRLINLKMNYRNHRKIVVIDGKIGYVGGVNLRKDHMGEVKKVAPWRDAHIKIRGQAVHLLQNEFLNFWQFCNKKTKETQEFADEGYFPKIVGRGSSIVQVLTSGPEEVKKKEIKEAMVKMISTAEREIIIQTPYFVPDDVFLSALKTAVASGVRVRIMLPAKPDKRVVYKTSIFYAREMAEAGAEIYLFDGFVHAKNLIVDGLAMCTGTTNIDYRSFNLNFEISTIIYDKTFIDNVVKLFEKDVESSSIVEVEDFKHRSAFDKLQQVFFRLFSPLM